MISKEELKVYFDSIGMAVSYEDINVMMEIADTNGDGIIQPEEFIAAIEKGK